MFVLIYVLIILLAFPFQVCHLGPFSDLVITKHSAEQGKYNPVPYNGRRLSMIVPSLMKHLWKCLCHTRPSDRFEVTEINES